MFTTASSVELNNRPVFWKCLGLGLVTIVYILGQQSIHRSVLVFPNISMDASLLEAELLRRAISTRELVATIKNTTSIRQERTFPSEQVKNEEINQEEWWLDPDFQPYEGTDEYWNATEAFPHEDLKRLHGAKIYFIHVGKAGGSSLRDKFHLERLYKKRSCRMQGGSLSYCMGNFPKRMSAIAKHILGHFHIHNPDFTVEEREWLRNETNLLLFTVRSPIDRTVSAWNFHHHQFFKGEDPKPRHEYDAHDLGATLFIDCFRQVDDLAQAMMGEPSQNDSRNTITKLCQSLGRALLEGRVHRRPCPHLRWNYQYYANAVWSNRSKAVAVLRTEHQWEDLARLEALLGGNPARFFHPNQQVKYTHGSEAFKLKTGVSAQGAKSLCCVLVDELQVYHNLIIASLNLKLNQKIETVSHSLTQCGIDWSLTSEEKINWKWRTWRAASCQN